uniref:Glycosyltransferases n=1 Tax=Asparagus officinalis TaxID=4686 RepID=A0A0D3QH78_ASPOF|nr:glycosyltransferase family 43 IRX9-like protein [Asparagus officinalis]
MLYATEKMPSFRRTMSPLQRDGGAVQNGETAFDISPPPKLPQNRTYLAIGRLLNSLLNSLDFPGALFSRSYRPAAERSKPKGLHMKRSFFHYCLCFMLGIFVSFTPFFSVDVSKNLASRQHAFSFEDTAVIDNAKQKISSVEKEILFIEKSLSIENGSLEMKTEALDASNVTLSAYATPTSQHAGLVPQQQLIIVTPTYERPFQAYYLNRMAHTLKVVPPPLLWIVVEMSSQLTETAKILREAGVMYRHLVCKENVTSIGNREAHQRNVALSHIEKHQLDGIVHFADDDRMYSVELFGQMRQIRRFGAWPVATLSESKNKVLLEGPVCNGSQVIGWHTNQRSKLSQRFHLDMSGFAFNSTVLWDIKRWHRPTLEPIRQRHSSSEGFQATTFIEQLVEDESQMEGLLSNCSKILVWHLHLEAPELLNPEGWSIQKNLELVVPLT